MTEEWPHLVSLWEAGLSDALEKLEAADEKHFRYQQGRACELRKMLELKNIADAVIDAERTPRRTHSIE
jgi:hypothetical protein